MQRVLVIGPGGSGKSTFSIRLGKTLGIPVIHLDSLYWKSGWVESDKAEWSEQIRTVIAQKHWIIDGNYSGTLRERIDSCDTVVFLDVPRATCLWRVLKRTLRYYGATRPEMPEGCPERFDLAFMAWIWNYPSRSRKKVLSLIQESGDTKNIIRLRSNGDIESFLAS